MKNKQRNFNRVQGAPQKVDQVIIYNLFVLGRMTSKDYSNETDRIYKYRAIKDHILLSIDPLLVPKVKATEQAWADRYKELIQKLKETPAAAADDTFEILQLFMQLFATILYSTGHYELENIGDEDYEKYYMNSNIDADTDMDEGDMDGISEDTDND